MCVVWSRIIWERERVSERDWRKKRFFRDFYTFFFFLFRDVGRVRNWTILYRDFFGVTIETSRGQVKEEDKNLPTIFYSMLHVFGSMGLEGEGQRLLSCVPFLWFDWQCESLQDIYYTSPPRYKKKETNELNQFTGTDKTMTFFWRTLSMLYSVRFATTCETGVIDIPHLLLF